MNHNLKTRTIHTNLYGAQAYAVIDGVHGQLSDGKWENSPGYDKYWTNFDVKTANDGEVIFEVNVDYSYCYCNKWLDNPFKNMSDNEFKTWIARKIKAVVNDERKDRMEFGSWDRRNTDHTSLYLGHADEEYGPVVTVADIYCTYEALLSRNIGITKYDSSTICRVFGTKRTDEEIAKIKNAKETKDAIYAKYKVKINSLREAANEAIKQINDKLAVDINSVIAEQKAEIEKIEAV